MNEVISQLMEKVQGYDFAPWIRLAFWVIGAYALGQAIAIFLKGRAEKNSESRPLLSQTIRSIARVIPFLSILAGVMLGRRGMVFSPETDSLLDTLISVLFVGAMGFLFYRLVEVPCLYFQKKAEATESKLDDMVAPVLRSCLQVAVVVLTLVQIAQTLSDKPITSIIAGLGIGGIAVALAAQDTVKNFFGSLVLIADKPFKIGDRLVIDGHDGPVEKLGLRSTRIRTLDGHVVSIPNGELANKTIQNIGERPYIKQVMNITITYDTPSEKIDEALAILKAALDNHEGMDPEFPPRIFFNAFNDASLNILVIYWYHPPDYWTFMEFNENLNKRIFREFNEAGIDFAFPSQTLYLAGDTNRPLTVGLRQDGPESTTG